MELAGLEKSVFAYLFLVADEKLTSEKLYLFNELRTGNNEVDAKRNSLILECRKITGEDFNKYNGEKRFKMIFTTIKSIEEEVYGSWSDNPIAVQLECFWILTNLGCYDSISENQKKILAFLAQKWKISNIIQIEMKDTAETLTDIESYRKWLLVPKKYSGRYRKKVITELDKSEADLNQSIAYLVHDTAHDAEYSDDSNDDNDTEEDAKPKSKLGQRIDALEKAGFLNEPFYLWVLHITSIEIEDEYSSEKEKKQAAKRALKEAIEQDSFPNKVKAWFFLPIIYALFKAGLFFLKIPLRISMFFIFLKDKFIALLCSVRRGIKHLFSASKKKNDNPFDYSLALEEADDEDDEDESWKMNKSRSRRYI
jgi:hypothetical protein